MSKDLRTFEDVHNTYAQYLSDKDVKLADEAFLLAQKLHDGVVRKTGDPYISHPIAVAGILADLRMDASTIAAGFLHDVVEDTEITNQQIADQFGEEVGKIVEGVTKISKIEYHSSREQMAENHRKLLLAMAEDARVIIVKLADRLHNMRTLDVHRPEKQRRIAAETLEIYAPLAHRLGLAQIKWELEDLSLRYLEPDEYRKIAKMINTRREERNQEVDQVVSLVKDLVDQLDMKDVEIAGRSKHIYSIYRKMIDKNKQFSEIFDLLAIRILVDSVADVYSLLGAIHSKFKPVPGRFKDYIALPKPNGYQSLHTTVIGPTGRPIEIQIRTHDMHSVAELGVAAHWSYKQNKGSDKKVKINTDQAQLNKIKEILEMQEDGVSGANDLMESIAGDLFSSRSYAFTPNGDVIELAAGSTPLDMAYAIHSQVGDKATGAKVNGNIVPLTYTIQTGDIVEIITSKNAAPSRDWLSIVKTRRARNKISHYFKQLNREENISAGRSMIEKEISATGFAPEVILSEDNLADVVGKSTFNNADEMFLAVGYGDASLRSIMHRLTEKARLEQEEEKAAEIEMQILSGKEDVDQELINQHDKSKDEDDVIVEGMSSIMIRLGQCCTPIPGDDILGFITKGRGVSIHRVNCANIAKARENNERIIEAHWTPASRLRANHDADIQVKAEQRDGVLNDVVRVIQGQTRNLNAVNGRVNKHGIVIINLSLEVRDVDQLEHVMTLINGVKEVFEVERSFS